jgi:hypothetical protein
LKTGIAKGNSTEKTVTNPLKRVRFQRLEKESLTACLRTEHRQADGRRWRTDMAKQNQHVEDYLDAYCKMEDADFSVMITGPWGCGKTHFVRDYLDRKCTPNGKKEYLYVSLNGVNTVPDINLKLFGETVRLPAQKGRTGECLKKIFPEELREPAACFFRRHASSAAHVLKGVAQAKLNVSLSDLILVTGLAEQVKGRLLIFDDLERCILSPEEILGYINNFVEHSATKVVIIGEEYHLNKGSDEKYRVIKEKVVGKTFRLTEQIEEIFDDLISEKSYPKTHGIIHRNKAVTINLFQKVDKETKKNNYRALKHCLRDFEYFYPKIGRQFQENSEFLDALFKVFVVLDYELQLANFAFHELKPVDPVKYYAETMNKQGKQDQKQTPFEEMLDRHEFKRFPILSHNDLIFLEPLWCKILGNEQLDSEEIEETIKNSSYFISKARPEWVSLWHWRHIEDEDAEKALAAVRQNLKAYEYRSYEIIMHVFSILMGLSEHGAIPETKEDILDSAREYLDDLVEKRSFLVPEGRLSWHWTTSGSHGLAYWAKGDDFTRLVDIIDAAMKKTVQKNKVTSVVLWLKQLSDFPGEFYPKIDTNGEYCREPVMHLFDADQFVSAIAKIPNESKWMVSKLFENRYGHHGKELSDELPFVEKVVTAIEKFILQSKGGVKPSTVNMQDLKKEFEKARDVLRQSPPAVQ